MKKMQVGMNVILTHLDGRTSTGKITALKERGVEDYDPKCDPEDVYVFLDSSKEYVGVWGSICDAWPIAIDIVSWETISPVSTSRGGDTPRLTKRQAAIIGLYTGVAAGPFGDIQELGDKLLGRPTWTHEYGSKEFADQLKQLVEPLYMEICYEEEKSDGS